MDKTPFKTLLPPYAQAQTEGRAFAPSNIALCKYWGKRDQALNLPLTSSLSISLGTKGAHCSIRECNQHHTVTVNHENLPREHEFSQKLASYLNALKPKETTFYNIHFQYNIPIAAGVASSACTFAALVLALNDLYQWKLEKSALSVLCRLGSGSACRSLWPGFVKWERGVLDSGMDSHGYPLSQTWPEFCIGLHIITKEKKLISSREAMLRTANTAFFYKVWPDYVTRDLTLITTAIENKNFDQLGAAAQANALALHAMMLGSTPPIIYTQPKTLEAMRSVLALREEGHSIYFTQDAGANLKLLFLENEEATVKAHFPTIQVIKPFRDIP